MLARARWTFAGGVGLGLLTACAGLLGRGGEPVALALFRTIELHRDTTAR